LITAPNRESSLVIVTRHEIRCCRFVARAIAAARKLGDDAFQASQMMYRSDADMKSDDEEFELYEKIYLAEIDRKEKLISRLNLPLAMIVALLSFLSYLLAKAPQTDTTPGVYFWIMYLMAGVFVLRAMWHFAGAWLVRFDDLAIPVAEKLENHRKMLIEYYDGSVEQANSFFMQIMMDYYVMGATKNATNNDRRGSELDALSRNVIYAVIWSMTSFVPVFISTRP
jgi:hypothetical protein